MTVTLGPTPRYQWQGLSSDTKPTGITVGVNDIFFETDTGNYFLYSGTGWNPYTTSSGGTTTAANVSYNNSGTSLVNTNVQTAITALSQRADLLTPFDFGAIGGNPSNVATMPDDTTALTNWIASGKCYIPYGSFFKTTALLSVPKNGICIGPGGPSHGIVGSGFSGAIMQIGDGGAVNTGTGLGDNARVWGFSLGGTTADKALKIGNAQELIVGDIWWAGAVTGSRTANLFWIENTWDNELGPFYTNGNLSGVMNACYYLSGVVNSTNCRGFHTSNTCNYNVYSIADAVAVVFTKPVIQGGDIGFKMQIGYGCGLVEPYFESVGIPIDLGDETVAGRIVRGFLLEGGNNLGKSTYASRGPAIDLRNVYGFSMSGGHRFRGISADTMCVLTITDGTGTGAIAVMRPLANGTAHSVEVIYGGINYSGAPTITPTIIVNGVPTGTGDATFTATVSGGVIQTIAVSTPGTVGVMPAAPTTPVGIRLWKCYRSSVTVPQVNDGKNGELSPFYPWVVRSSTADTASGITIISDSSIFNATTKMEKLDGVNYKHWITSKDSLGFEIGYGYTPPVYP